MDNNNRNNMSREHRQRTRNNALASENNGKIKRPFLKIIGLVFLVMIFVMGAYGFRLYAQAQNSLGKTYKALDGKTVSTRISDKKPVSILLLGVDTTDNGVRDTETDYHGNSDTMIVVTVNPKTNKTTMMSVPRDSMAQIWKSSTKNTKKIQKINSAYNIGNEEAAVATTEKFLNIPIQYYVKVDFNSLKQIVNAVGGVDVKVPFSFSYGDTGEKESHFTKGKMHLNGKQALDYSRMRYEDPQGDYGRQLRQRQIITAIIKSAASAKTFTHYQKVLDSISSSMTTNLSFNDMQSMFLNYRGASKDIGSDHVQGYGSMIDGSSYEVIPTKELQRASNKLRKQLGLSEEELDNEETRLNTLNEDRGFSFKSEDQNQNYTIFTRDQTSE
ncbi:transcriptional regulator [Companilactobacillus crustorum]|uniref:Transcriptional regulator n=3 Tax=Companilactobacillus TaxID=2767879 RepID=A0A837RIG5_9LACO|nr:LCP family protein [Companilactobacillus crustorum]KRK43531.1 transcriptional regulator [Companilactobacillus crustorum JCM 15951]HCD06707.1 LytR family transcriptional regulator [Lactobacillus sp.]APU72488.1 Transcriptional regulator LytR [Companilactobacillus crustorum]KRO20958.1 transcriptional regulator [Companilactobacillus crustorum]GEO77620.1 transcriptional regulator [Companilactobacillus crustorum]